MKTSKVNCNRIILGGLAGGVVMNLIDFFVNGVLLADKWKAANAALLLDPAVHCLRQTVGWVSVDFIASFIIVWIYAAIRPRYGAGPKTAARAALTVWASCGLMLCSYWFTGLYPSILIAGTLAGTFVSTNCSAMIGGYLYKE